MIVEDQLVFDDLDPAPVPQWNRLERRQPLTVELGAALAFQVHEKRCAVRPVLDAGVMPRDARVIEVNVQPSDPPDVQVGPF